ncbi:MAG: DUF4153 domain-containing protein [Alphaproteobacteria bacterium]
MINLTNRLYLFPLIGVVQGLALTTLIKLDQPHLTPQLIFIFAFVGLAPALFYFTYERPLGRSSILFSGGIGAALAALFTWGEYRFTHDTMLSLGNGIGGWHFWAAIVPAIILLAYFRAFRGETAPSARYRAVYDSIWTLFLSSILAAIFTGLLWLLLFLWWSLFGLIGITIFESILTDDYVAPAIIFGALGAGVAIILEQGNILTAARSLVLSLLRTLAPLVAVFLIVFLGFLPFTGLELLWDTNAASAILLSMVLAAGLLINATIQADDTVVNIPPLIRRLLQVAALLLPVPVLIAAYALWLRVDQYGLTPERVVAANIVVTATLFTAGHALSGLFSSRWPEFIRRCNFLTLPLAGLFGLALLTPIGDPYRLSVTSQLYRLETAQVGVDDFDLGMLQFELGATGRQAIEEIRAGQHVPEGTDMTDALTRLDQTRYYYEWRDNRAHSHLESGEFDAAKWQDAFLVRPANAPFPNGFAAFLHQQGNGLMAACADNPAQRCAVLVGQVFPDTPAEIVLVTGNIKEGWLRFEAYRQAASQTGTLWHQFAHDFTRPDAGEDVRAIWQAIERGDITYTPTTYNMINLGDYKHLLSPDAITKGAEPFRPALKPHAAPLPNRAMTK